jgi:asparagine synthase (glutamine-hydrolysing)
MCGILASLGTKNLFDEHVLDHRGPDQRAVYKKRDLTVVFSRLSVTGGISGDSPVISKDGRFACFLNGEIYNYKSLASSHALPSSNSDTQVLADGFSKIGFKFLHELRGMFAGLIFDTVTEKVIVFRDSLGEKPLFYSQSDEGFIVASEFSAVLKQLKRPLAIDQIGLADYFRLGYIEEPRTIDRGISAFSPGTVCEFSLSPPTKINHESLSGFSMEEIEQPLEDLISHLIKESGETEVPSALALSGGIDSSSLLLQLKQIEGNETSAIIVDYPEFPDFSEAREAQYIAKKLKVDFEMINPFQGNLVEKISQLAAANDQPHSDAAGLQYYSIFQHANKMSKKVVFLGHGPDEFFWGYEWLNQELLKGSRGIKFFRQARDISLFDYRFTPATSSLYAALKIGSNFQNRTYGSEDPFLNSLDPSQRTRANLVHSYLTHNGLRQNDRLAMTHGIEPRTPYADSRLYAWTQLRGASGKNAFDKREFRSNLSLPQIEFQRSKKKIGFRSPLYRYLNEDSELKFQVAQGLEFINDENYWKPNVNVKNLNMDDKYKLLMLNLWVSAL